MTKSLGNEALSNYNKGTWKIRVEKRKSQKKTKKTKLTKNKTYEHIYKNFTFMTFVA